MSVRSFPSLPRTSRQHLPDGHPLASSVSSSGGSKEAASGLALPLDEAFPLPEPAGLV